MSKALVPPHGSCIIRCKKCKGLYTPENITGKYYDVCPFCGAETNGVEQTIPVWLYNLLKFFRSGTHVEDIEDKMVNFKTPEPKPVEVQTEKKDPMKEFEKTTDKTLNLINHMLEDLKLIEEKPKEPLIIPEKKEPKSFANKDSGVMLPPKAHDFIYQIHVRQGNSTAVNTYYLYGVLDSISRLPYAEKMPTKRAAYYIKSRDKFATVNGVLWTFDNELEKSLWGKKRVDLLNSIYEEVARNGKTDS